MTHSESAPKPMIHLQRLLPASPREVFNAWIDPESLRQWFCPGTVSLTSVELDVRVGGHFRIFMREDNKDLVHTGTYREIDPPQRLVFTWRSRGTYDQETLVTVELHARGEMTELELTHTLFPDGATASNHERGWQSIVEKCARHLSAKRP